jgi:hypothetical protein
MKLNQFAITAILLLALASAASAQSAAVRMVSSGPARDGVVAVVDVSRLPIDIRRIERSLKETTIREERDGLNLRYFVDVYAKAPPIVLFTPEDNLLTGPVPYGGPTHREMLEMMTPREYRAPAADFGNLLRWLSGKTDKN